MTNVNFEYELQSGQVLVCDAEITEGCPPLMPDMNDPGDPGIDPVVELGDIYLKGEDGMLCKFDPDGHWVRREDLKTPNGPVMVFRELATILEVAALNAYEAQK